MLVINVHACLLHAAYLAPLVLVIFAVVYGIARAVKNKFRNKWLVGLAFVGSVVLDPLIVEWFGPWILIGGLPLQTYLNTFLVCTVPFPVLAPKIRSECEGCATERTPESSMDLCQKLI